MKLNNGSKQRLGSRVNHKRALNGAGGHPLPPVP